jgi:hypothetical protein
MKTDPRVDAYIAEAPPFAQPILQEARSRVGKACPSAEETIKWNVPFFLLGDKILASMAAFKKHVKVGVWTGMMPKFVDVNDVEDLPSSKDFAQQLQTAAKAIDSAMTSKPVKDAAATRTKPAAGKRPTAIRPAATKPAATKPAATKPAATKPAATKPAATTKAPEKASVKKAASKNPPAKKASAKQRARAGK